jgi:signal transduction histidine kinase
MNQEKNRKLKRLSDDILDIAKIESNTSKLNKEKFDLVELLLNIKDEYKTICNTNKITIILSIKRYYESKDNFMVYADKSKLNQNLSNLIDDAIKFISEGSITITVQKNYNNNKKEECVIDVIGIGVGIHKEIFPRLFSKFATMSKDGTRLGLHLQKNY